VIFIAREPRIVGRVHQRNDRRRLHVSGGGDRLRAGRWCARRFGGRFGLGRRRGDLALLFGSPARGLGPAWCRLRRRCFNRLGSPNAGGNNNVSGPANRYCPFSVAKVHLVGWSFSSAYTRSTVKRPTPTSAPTPITDNPARLMLVLPATKSNGSAGAAEPAIEPRLRKARYEPEIKSYKFR
jgi:hypothetical protein